MCDTMRAAPGVFLGANPEALLRDCPMFRGQSKSCGVKKESGPRFDPLLSLRSYPKQHLLCETSEILPLQICVPAVGL